jgi:hypothetical protein
MDWETKEINNWQEYITAVCGNIGEKTDLPYRKWIFRGQSNSEWKLEPKFKRVHEEIKIIKESAGDNIHKDRRDYEKKMIEEFISKSHLYLKGNPNLLFPELDRTNSNLEWLSIMQHFGAPTRLLDFSFSPFVALFFALIDTNGEKGCYVYAINREIIEKKNKIFFGKSDYYTTIFENENRHPYIYPFEPRMKNERLSRQQGLFLVPSTTFSTVDDIIQNYNDSENPSPFTKYSLHKEMIYESLKMLKKMNITHESLFPDLTGLCYSLKFLFLELDNDRIGK